MRILLLCISIVLITSKPLAQTNNFQSVKGLPSDEVYDLFADSKGFIWAAHSLGISRYDGMNFKDFNHPLATGAGITDIVEDKQGRIWCHNFNGQVFYIENEQMYLLDAYKYKEEYYYPRMQMLDNNLIITSDKGLFVLDTKNLSSSYIKINNFNKRQNSLTTTKKGDIIFKFNSNTFFSYSQTLGIRQLIFQNDTKETKLLIQTFRILPLSSDTIYAIYDYNKIGKFYVKNDTIHLTEIHQERNKINTIIICDQQTWINTKTESHTTDKKNSIYDKNISDIIIDNDGNKWFSSLESGIFMISKNRFWQKDSIPPINTIKDQIYSHIQVKNYHIYGSQKGFIFLKKISTNKINTFHLPTISGNVEKLYALNDKEIIIAPSTGCYLLNIPEKKITTINSDFLTIKGIVIKNNKIIIGHTNCITSYATKDSFISHPEIVNIMTVKRCYAIIYNNLEDRVLAAFSNGLHELKNDSSFKPILYNNEIISASSLLSVNDKVFVTTFNNGLFIIDEKGIRKKSTLDGLISNKIFKIKHINNQIFIIEQKNIQILDIASEKIIKTIALPTEKSSVVYDLWQEDSLICLSSNKGLYKFNLQNLNNTIIPKNYILSISSDTSFFSPNIGAQLPYSQNNIQFKVISPSFIYPEYTYFKYRILGSNDTAWQQTTTNESNISFAALKPGDYTFEAYAINFQNSRGETLQYHFTILKPWWQQWWFISIILLSMGLIIYYSVQLRIKVIDKKNNEAIEKIALTSELRKSQLSTIVAQMNLHFIFNTLNTIQGLIYKNDKPSSIKYIGKFSELVRDILNNSNQEEISLNDEINHLNIYLELEKMRFEGNLNISLHIDDDIDRDNIMLPPILIQPYIENAIVHGLFHKKGDKNLKIHFSKSTKDNYLQILISDNGIGRALSQQLNAQRRKHISFALSAIQKRVNLLNQTLDRKIEIKVEDNKDEMDQPLGTTVIISIPINNLNL